MKLRNPNYISNAEKTADELSGFIDTYIAAMPTDREYISFDEIRADIDSMGLTDAAGTPITSEKLTDGVIEMICQKKGIEVEA